MDVNGDKGRLAAAPKFRGGGRLRFRGHTIPQRAIRLLRRGGLVGVRPAYTPRKATVAVQAEMAGQPTEETTVAPGTRYCNTCSQPLAFGIFSAKDCCLGSAAMRVLTSSRGSRAYGFDDVEAALRIDGHELVDVSAEKGPLRGDALIVLGLGNWSRELDIGLLDQAKAEGIPRILWQFEPLLPPGLQERTRPMIPDHVSADAELVEPSGIFARAAHAAQVCRLLLAARQQPWGGGITSPHMFKFPIDQTRNVVRHWRQGRFDRIFVSLRPRSTFLAEIGIASDFVPIGYAPTLGRNLGESRRDIDVLFFGYVSSRRRALLRTIRSTLQKQGFNLTVVTRDCYGEERTALINRTKIVLNLHKFPWEFAGMRLLMSMSCGALVVSEWAPDTSPYVDGEHLFAPSVRDLPDTIVRLLQDDRERLRVSQNGYRFATEHMTVARLLTPALRSVLPAGTG